MGGKHFPLVIRSVLLVDGCGDGIRDIQCTFILLGLSLFVVLDMQVPEWLVILVQASEPVLTDQVGNFRIFSGFHQPDCFVEHFRRDFYVFENDRRFPAV